MNKELVAKASISIKVPIFKAWAALVDPEMIKQYMFGAEVISDWKEGGFIVWKGVWEGKAYEDKGVILKLNPHKLLQYTHFSPLAGLPETPENYHTVTYELSEEGSHTLLVLSQDNNPTEKDRDHSAKMWETMLEGIKKLLEK